MPDVVLALDVGGTSVKLALIDPDGQPLPGTTGQADFDADGTRDAILDAFCQAALSGLRMAEEAGCIVSACGVAFPGPFDYGAGISHMEHKMRAIQGVPLTPVFQRALRGVPVRYLHDSTAYLLGEAAYGAAVGADSPACVMLGTGLGFAYMRGGRVRVGHDQRPHRILWNMSYRDGIAEDYVSRRALRARYGRAAGSDPPDVKEIARRALAGDAQAANAFAETGAELAGILGPELASLGCDLLVVGGQIARSAALFLPSLAGGLPVPVRVATHLDDAALRGAARFCLLPDGAAVEEAER